MIDSDAAKKLKTSLMSNCPTLFLGAGFSREAVCASGTMPTGKELCRELRERFVQVRYDEGELTQEELDEISGYTIRDLCNCIDDIYQGNSVRNKYLTERLKGAVPNDMGYHEYLLSYPWKRIYTVNIDDLVENVYEQGRVTYKSFCSKEYIPDKNNDDMILVKLHGDVRKPEKGYIFSRDEYNELITQKIDLGLSAFAGELYSTSDIIFIGASLDEPDFEYYMQIYEGLKLKSQKNQLFFIDPAPSVKLKNKAKKLGAVVVNATAEEFLTFVKELNYDPDEIERTRLELNYNMIFRLADTIELFKTPYESNIYQGFMCSWQDVFDKWTFENEMFENAKKQLDHVLAQEVDIKGLCLYGGAFSGKSTLLKQMGKYLHVLGYEVLEYRGRYLNRRVLREYIEKSPFANYALLVDNASFYYAEIERMYHEHYTGKRLFFLCASRTYYHNRKKYYLDGNCYYECSCSDLITKKDAEIIERTLEQKHSLSNLIDLPVQKRRQEILKKRSIVNLMIDLTYGSGLVRKIKSQLTDIRHLNSQEFRLLLEVAIFDKADIEYFPMELFVERYGTAVALDQKIEIHNLRIVDYLKYDDRGLSLRNTLFRDELLRQDHKQTYKILVELLRYISRYVREGNNDIWVIIFQSLLNEKRVAADFQLTTYEREKMLYSLREHYSEISYYWLQLGIFEQQKGFFDKALSHLKVAQHIQPTSFKIKHAIARNYLIYANSKTDRAQAATLFEIGERLMRELLTSTDYYIRKAKPFSVSCFVVEKVRYIKKFSLKATNKELAEMRELLSGVYRVDDEYITKAMQDFYQLLCSIGKQGMIRMTPESPYYDIMRRTIMIDEERDVLIESI